ncbi:unnamed protein product [Closterium sp. Naga37s-1]|nr:unnamed protein product [Closterium sp. Naga37s-1]
MVMEKSKRARASDAGGKEAKKAAGANGQAAATMAEEKLAEFVEKMRKLHEEIEEVTDKATEEVLEVERSFVSQRRRPLYDKRKAVLDKIPHFWQNVLCNCGAIRHSTVEQDVKVLKHLTSLDVEECKEEGDIGYTITMDELTLRVTGTRINWKEWQVGRARGEAWGRWAGREGGARTTVTTQQQASRHMWTMKRRRLTLSPTSLPFSRPSPLNPFLTPLSSQPLSHAPLLSNPFLTPLSSQPLSHAPLLSTPFSRPSPLNPFLTPLSSQPLSHAPLLSTPFSRPSPLNPFLTPLSSQPLSHALLLSTLTSQDYTAGIKAYVDDEEEEEEEGEEGEEGKEQLVR